MNVYRLFVPTFFFLVFPFTLGPQALSQLLEISNVLIVLLFFVWIIRLLAAQRGKLKRAPLDRPVLLFLAIVILSYFRNPRPIDDRTNLVHIEALLAMMMYLVSSNFTRKMETFLRLRNFIFLAYNAAFLTTLLIYFTGVRLPFMASMEFSHRQGTIWSFGVHGVGVYGIACLVFLLAQPGFLKSRPIRLGLIGLYTAALPLSGSRTVPAELFGALVSLLIVRRKWRHLVGCLVLVIAVVAAVVLCYDLLPPELQRMFLFSAEFYSTTSRLIMWRDSIMLGLANPIFGIGYGIVESPDTLALLADMPIHGDAQLMFSRAPHNSYVYIFRSLGLLGIGVFGWLVRTFFIQTSWVSSKVADRRFQDFVVFVMLSVLVILIDLGIGGGETKPRLYFWLGISSGCYKAWAFQEKSSA